MDVPGNREPASGPSPDFVSNPASRAHRVRDKTLLTQGLLRVRHLCFPSSPNPPLTSPFPSVFSLLATSGFKAAVRATPVSFHTVRPAAQRASLQVVAADKMTRPNLDHPDLEQFKTGPNDTGSSSLQIALLTKRIESLTDHLMVNKKDYATQRGLRMLLGQRSRLSNYLKKKDPAQYEKTMDGLGLKTK